jgi:hypothetical protein
MKISRSKIDKTDVNLWEGTQREFLFADDLAEACLFLNTYNSSDM